MRQKFWRSLDQLVTFKACNKGFTGIILFTMLKSIEARRRARRNYDIRMRERGLKKYTIWLPEKDLNKLRGSTPIQEFFENLLEQNLLKDKGQ
jgi:hypothetical protein